MAPKPPSAQAAEPKSFTCDASSIRWEPSGPPAPPLRDAPRNPRPSGIFFNRGQKSWPLFARNKPATGVYWASACPVDAMLSPGPPPFPRSFSVRAGNLYGITDVTLGFQFLLQTGRRSENPGDYITRLEISPDRVNLAWGWNVDMTVVIQNPAEFGDPAAPSAALPVQLQLTIETEIKTLQDTKVFMVFPQGILAV